jgi:membrane protease YdiL (CAAX protease family)
LTTQPVEGLERPLGRTFDFASWRLGPTRLLAAGCVATFAASAWAEGGAWRLAGSLLVLDVVLQVLPWRLPRSHRTTSSILLEESMYLLVPTVFLAVVLVERASWITALPAPWWYAVAAAVGVVLVRIGGMPIRALLTGALAFLAPPLRRTHKWVRVISIVVAPPGEEALFRGVVLAASHAAGLPLGLAGGAAFVARHHLPPGFNARTSRRVFLAQVVAASALLVLTLASGSIYPALLAHLVNNAPSLLLEGQRRTTAP